MPLFLSDFKCQICHQLVANHQYVDYLNINLDKATIEENDEDPDIQNGTIFPISYETVTFNTIRSETTSDIEFS